MAKSEDEPVELTPDVLALVRAAASEIANKTGGIVDRELLDAAIAGEVQAMAIAEVKLKATNLFMETPEYLSGRAAEEWADKKLTQLLPLSVRILEQKLKYGTPREQVEAAKEIRESTGRGKRDQSVSAQPLIIIQGGGVVIPWAQGEAPAMVTSHMKTAALLPQAAAPTARPAKPLGAAMAGLDDDDA